jgi:flagellar FliL protein
MAIAKPALKSAPPPAVAEEAPPPKKKSKLWLIIGIVVALVLLAVGGGATWYLLRAKEPAPVPGAAAGATAVPEAKTADAKPPTFVTLEPFTVNLQQENGDHFLQAGIVIQVAEPKVGEAMKTYMPIIRNRILLLLSSKMPSELVSLDGKKKLVSELIAAVRESIPGASPERGIENAYISSFVIQ